MIVGTMEELEQEFIKEMKIGGILLRLMLDKMHFQRPEGVPEKLWTEVEIWLGKVEDIRRWTDEQKE